MESARRSHTTWDQHTHYVSTAHSISVPVIAAQYRVRHSIIRHASIAGA